MGSRGALLIYFNSVDEGTWLWYSVKPYTELYSNPWFYWCKWEPMHRDDFPGLYLESPLPISPFLELDNGTYIVTHSIWSSRLPPLLISAQDGRVLDLRLIR